MKVLLVLTSHDRLGDTGRKTGFWLEELAAPYYVFRDAGAEIVLASPRGGQPPLDPKSSEPDFQTDLTRRFEADPAAKAQLAATLRLDGVSQAEFDTVFYPGGHGPLWDLAEDKAIMHLTNGSPNHYLPVAASQEAAGAPAGEVAWISAPLMELEKYLYEHDLRAEIVDEPWDLLTFAIANITRYPFG